MRKRSASPELYTGRMNVTKKFVSRDFLALFKLVSCSNYLPDIKADVQMQN